MYMLAGWKVHGFKMGNVYGYQWLSVVTFSTLVHQSCMDIDWTTRSILNLFNKNDTNKFIWKCVFRGWPELAIFMLLFTRQPTDSGFCIKFSLNDGKHKWQIRETPVQTKTAKMSIKIRWLFS